MDTNQNVKFNGENIKRMLLFVLIGLSIIQQMPIIKDFFYSETRLILYIGFGVLAVISLIKIEFIFKVPLLILFACTIIYAFLMSMLELYIHGGDLNFLELVVPFGILISSITTHYSKRNLNNVMMMYIVLSFVLGISSVFYYGDGFRIAEQYFLAGKNQIGPMLGISIIMASYLLFNPPLHRFKYENKLIYTLLLGGLLLSLLALRNRSSLLGIAIVFAVILLSKLNYILTMKKVILFSLTSLVLTMAYVNGYLDPVFDFISKSLFLNFNVSDLNSVSTGRTDVYIEAIEFAARYPFFGELGNIEQFSAVPHNYILNKWVNYGIVFSIPFVLFYVYLWIFAFIHLLNENSKFKLPFWILIFSLIVSLFEYTFPYGPGVSQLSLWFLLGQHFRKNEALIEPKVNF